MTKTTIFDTNKFANRIKTTLQQLESETDAKLSSLMMAEATSKVNGIDKVSKNFHDAVKITSTDRTKIPKFPDEIYAAVMKRIVAVETPKFTSSSSIINTNLTKIFGTAGVTIVKQIGSYISDLLDSKSESISVDGTTYILSNPFGTTSSIVEVNIKDSNKKYTFSWNDDKATQDSFNSYMKSLAEYETENCLAVFFAILKDVKDIAGSSAGSSTNLLSKWSKGLMYGKKVDKYLSQLKDTEFFRVLSSYQNMPNESISTLIADIADVIIPILKTHISLQSPNTKAKKWLDTYSKATETIEGFISWTEEIFDDDKKTISKITKKYNSLLDKSVALATFITKYDGSDESFIKELAKNSSTFGDFISAYNELETQIGRSKTSFASMLEDYTFYKITDVHDETISENHATIYGTNQNDTITVKGRNVKIYAGEGADRIIATSQYITLIGEQGNDHFMLNDFANSNYVDAGADDDTILSYSKNNTINGNSGNDSILVSAYSDFTTKNEVHGGAGDDTINVTAAIDNTVLGEEGNDFIQISEDANNNTIIGGKNNDTITIENSTRNFIVYSEGDGNDFIYGLGSTDTLYIAEDDFSQSTNGTDAIVSVGNSRITLKNAAGKKVNIKKRLTNEEWLNEMFNNKVTFGTSKGDIINNTVNGSIIDAGTGNDSIYNYYASTVKIDAGDGDDSISNGILSQYGRYHSGNYVTMDGGEGDDSISNGSWYTGGSYASINGGDGNDSIFNHNFSNNVTIDGGNGDDSIENRYCDTVFIDGGLGNNKIGNGGDNVTIACDIGDDTIKTNGDNTSINSGMGNDSIINECGDNVTINADDGNDFIYNYGYNSSSGNPPDEGCKALINGRAGNDTIDNKYNLDVTITGDEGNDSISNTYGYNTSITGGDGNDSIENNWGPNVTITGNYGNDYIYNSGDSITIDGGLGDDYILIHSYANNNLILYNTGDGNDSIKGFNATSTLQIGDGSDTYSTQVSGSNIIINIGTDSISLVGLTTWSKPNIIGKKEDLTTLNINDSTNSPITTGIQTETIDASSRTKAIQITGNSLDNSITGGKGNDTLNGANGDDTLTGGKGNDFFIYNSGNDIITDYEKGKDKISLDSASISNFTTINKDVIFALSNNNSLTLNNMADKQISFISSSKTTKLIFTNNASLDSSKKGATLIPATTEFSAVNYSGIVTINAENVSSAVNIIGNNKANKIIAGNYGSTLNGGNGNDSLIGGNSSDIFIYENKSGNKIIQNYSSSDTISLVGAQLSDASIKGKDVVLKVGSKKITVKGATSQEITIIEDDTTKFFVDNILYDEDKTSAILSSKFSAKTEKIFDSIVSYIDASNAKKKLILTSDYSGSSTILGGKKNDSLTGNSGNDILYGGKGNDSLYGSSGNDTLWGEAGKDKLYGGNGSNTLIGGKGNDSLWGGNDTDTFIYSKSDGKDIIYGFDDTDILQITDTFSTTYNSSKSEIYFKVGSTKNAITLKNFTATNFNINNDSYQISGSTLVKK